MVTLNRVNKALEAAGINGELFKGDGYFYFMGESFDKSNKPGVYVVSINQLTFEQWMEEAKQRIEA